MENSTSVPFVVRSDWDASVFIQRLQSGDLSLAETSFRVLRLFERRTTQETECLCVDATFRDFFEYLSRVRATKSGNPMPQSAEYNPFDIIISPTLSGHAAVYADYKRFHELFGLEGSSWNGKWSEILPDVDPSALSERNNTLWLGTRGSHTPLHFDSYGVNLVAQLAGRKNWKLWCPSSISHDRLLPRRIPYEESSIYCNYDPLSMSTIPPDFEFTLSPGDVLFVPKHYWHFVSTESEWSLSVNNWISQPTDVSSRFSEAIVRFVMTTMLRSFHRDKVDSELATWVCPSEFSLIEQIEESEAARTVEATDKAINEATNEAKLVAIPEEISVLITAWNECHPSQSHLPMNERLKCLLSSLLSPKNIDNVMRDLQGR